MSEPKESGALIENNEITQDLEPLIKECEEKLKINKDIIKTLKENNKKGKKFLENAINKIEEEVKLIQLSLESLRAEKKKLITKE